MGEVVDGAKGWDPPPHPNSHPHVGSGAGGCIPQEGVGNTAAAKAVAAPPPSPICRPSASFPPLRQSTPFWASC